MGVKGHVMSVHVRRKSGSDLVLWHHDSDVLPVQQVGEGRNVMIGNQDRDTPEPQGVHQARTPCLVAASTQAELRRL